MPYLVGQGGCPRFDRRLACFIFYFLFFIVSFIFTFYLLPFTFYFVFLICCFLLHFLGTRRVRVGPKVWLNEYMSVKGAFIINFIIEGISGWVMWFRTVG
jgi:hypothetical protein